MNSIASLLHQETGPLTRDLLLRAGGFGLGQVPERLAPDATTTMVCGYCSTGCGLNVHLKNGEAVSLTPSTDYPVNLGMACPKGWEALSVLNAADRATTPLLRNSSGRLAPVDWPTALSTFVSRFRDIQHRHGPESVAFLSTGQMVTEEMALLGSLAKFGMGMLHGDGNTRQCMATAAVAYKQSFGFDAPPYTYADFEESDTIVLVGSNLCIAHPIMWERVMRNRHKPNIIVVDPRRTETAMNAGLHLPAFPKSDLALFYGVARELIARCWIDRAYLERHTAGFDAFATFVDAFTIDRVCAETGLSPAAIDEFTRLIYEGRRVSFWWTMGVNQSHQGVRTAQALINLALMTGNIGRPGTGANSITGQCNAMGSRLFSNTTNLLGGRDFTDAEQRREVATVLQIDESRIPRQPSWAYHEILEGILRGSIHGLWVVCTNTSHSWINQTFARDVLGRLDFLVVQDMYASTETVAQAHLLLPAAGWGEKDGTFINSERRVGVVKKVRRAPGQALADFAIFRLIADAWGCGDLFKNWTSPAAAFEFIKQLSRGLPCDMTGIRDYQHLDQSGGIQWPYPEGTSSAETQRRLFEDGRFYFDEGRARFLFEAPRPLPEPTNAQYPLLLLTGRGSASQWHTQTRTAKSAVLRKLYPHSLHVEVNPQDANDLGIKPHERVVVESRRGALHAYAFFTTAVPVGQVFLPMHDAQTNLLTDAVFDPYSKQPAYKACAVRVLKVALGT
ncbi:MAG: nitrate reductase [Planctomycetaceae bacterium]|nr:nitrate reductase [Planctomycetaceae bacterium]